MRPYLAIVWDCFREAVASRVLPIMLGVATLFLAALAPLGLVEKTARTEFENGDFRNLGSLGEAASKPDAPPAARRVWERIGQGARRQLELAAEGEIPQIDTVTAAFNALLDDRGLYDPDLWKGHPLPDESSRILAVPPKERTAAEARRLNRLAVDVLFPTAVRPSLSTVSYVSYGGATLEHALPLELSQAPVLMDTVVGLYMTWLLGPVGLAAAIVATAGVIPHAFEPGMGELLASKPVSRVGVFLARFVGGLAFILLTTTYALGGLWLILGLRFGAWLPQVLLSIPVFLFAFAIYFAVSAWAGLVWRNSIAALLWTGLFYGGCLTLSWTHHLFEGFHATPQTICWLVPDGPVPAMVNERGETCFWSPTERRWEPGFLAPHETPFGFGASARQRGPWFDAARNEYRALVLSRPSAPVSPRPARAAAEPPYSREDGARLPADTAAIFPQADGSLLVVRPTGLYRVAEPFPPATEEEKAPAGGKPTVPLPAGVEERGDSRDEKSPADDAKEKPKQTAPAEAVLERLAGQADAPWALPLAAAFDPVAKRAAVWSNGRLELLAPDAAGKYAVEAKADLRDTFIRDFFYFDDWRLAVVGFVGERLIVAQGDGQILIFGRDLSLEKKFRPAGNNFPRFIAAAADGSQAVVLFQHGWGWKYDAATGAGGFPNWPEQGEWNAVAYGADGSLWTSSEIAVVRRWNARHEQPASFEGRMDWSAEAYRRFTHPLYLVLPKPNDFGHILDYLRTGRETVPTVNPTSLADRQIRQPVRNNVASGLAFIFVVLAVCCRRVYTSEVT